MIKVKNISSILNTKSGYNYVLNDISMELEFGKTIGVIGESGSGKTQLILALTGNQPLTPGIYNGQVIYNIDSKEKSLYPDLESSKYSLFKRNNNYHRRHQHNFFKKVDQSFSELKQIKIGYIPQDPRVFLNPYWTIELLFRQVYHKIKPEITFDYFFDKYISDVKLDAESIKNQYPHELSGGMAQRVMIAFILSQKPDILIGDECTTGLDVGNQKSIIELLQSIKENNPLMTLILISHDIGFLNHLVDDVYVMYGGYLIEHITDKNNLFNEKYTLHPYTKDLRDSLIPKSEYSSNTTDELTANIKLSRKTEGCPYSRSGRCKIYNNNNSLDCETIMPGEKNRNNPSDNSVDLLNAWVRCWGIDE